MVELFLKWVSCPTLFLALFFPPGLWAAKCTSETLLPGDYVYVVAGQDVQVHVPSGYTGQTPTPVLFDLHGAGGTGSTEKARTGFLSLSDKQGFIAVWPSGPNRYWACLGCSWDKNSVDQDVSLIRLVVDQIRRVANVDRSRIYVTGISIGGAMTNTLACEAADVFAAVAPAAFQLAASPSQCVPSRPIPVLEFHGYGDTVIPYGGSASLGLPSAETSLRRWAEIMGCSGDPEVTVLADNYSKIETYTSCRGGVQIGLASLNGVHDIFYEPPPSLDIPEYEWNFFMKFRLPLTTSQLDECPADPPSPHAEDAGGGGGGGCFIATAAYGSSLEPHVAVLRDFRDRYLLTNAPGKAFVEFYYHHAPPLANFVQKHGVLRMVTRWGLAPVIFAVRYPYGALMSFSLAIGIVAMVRLRRRRPAWENKEG